MEYKVKYIVTKRYDGDKVNPHDIQYVCSCVTKEEAQKVINEDITDMIKLYPNLSITGENMLGSHTENYGIVYDILEGV